MTRMSFHYLENFFEKRISIPAPLQWTFHFFFSYVIKEYSDVSTTMIIITFASFPDFMSLCVSNPGVRKNSCFGSWCLQNGFESNQTNIRIFFLKSFRRDSKTHDIKFYKKAKTIIVVDKWLNSIRRTLSWQK